MAFNVPNRYRVRKGRLASDNSLGNNGAFLVTVAHGQKLQVIATDGEGWEHVSVSRRDRCPTWSEMSQVKAMFWGPGDRVMQLHPPEAELINNHEFCLHLWRPVGVEIPSPPGWMVGVPGMSSATARRLLGDA